MKYKVLLLTSVVAISIMPCYTVLVNKLSPESLQILHPATNSWSYPANSMGIIYSQPTPYEPTMSSNVPIVIFGDDKLPVLSLVQQEKSSELGIQDSKIASNYNPTESQLHLSNFESHSIQGRDASRMSERSIQSLIEQLEILNSKILGKHNSYDYAEENTMETKTDSNILKINKKGSTPKINHHRDSTSSKSNHLSNKILGSDMFTENPKLYEYGTVTDLPVNSKGTESYEIIPDIPQKHSQTQKKESSNLYITDTQDGSSGERNVRHLDFTSQSTEVPEDISSVSTWSPQASSIIDDSLAWHKEVTSAKPVLHKNEAEKKLRNSNEQFVVEHTTNAQNTATNTVTKEKISNKLIKHDADIDPNSFKSFGTTKQTRQLPLGMDPVHDDTVQSSNHENEIFKPFTSPVVATLVPSNAKREHSHIHGGVPVHEHGKNYILTSSIMKAPTPFGGSVILYNTIVPPEQFKETLAQNKRSVYGIELLSPNTPKQAHFTTQDNAHIFNEQENAQFLNPTAVRLVPLPVVFSNSKLSNSIS